MAKKPLSKRGAERRALQELYQTATYAGLRNLADIGKLNISDIRKYYTDARAKAQKRIARIEKSDIPFTDKAPSFAKTSELTDEELLKSVGLINKFLLGPTTVTERTAAYNELLEDLHSKGMTFLEMSDLKDWDRFRKWVRAKGLLKIKYVDGGYLADIFIAGKEAGTQNSEFWTEEWDKLKEIIHPTVSGTRPKTKKNVKLNRKRGKK